MITLPLPTTVNATYRSGRGNFYKSKEAREWENIAGYMLLQYWKRGRIAGKVCVSITWYLKRDRDIDNCLKNLLDLFQKVGVLVNDNQVVHLDVKKREDKKNPRCEVEIEEVEEL